MLRVTKFLLSLLFGISMAVSAAPADDLDAGIAAIQHEWARIHYQLPKDQQDAAFVKLEAQADALESAHANRAEPKIWKAIVLSTHAGVSGGLGALSKVKAARDLLIAAEKIDATALNGSIYTSLGSLYYQVPGWPIGFGDKERAEEYFKKSLAINPGGIDPNFFYGEYLAERDRVDDRPQPSVGQGPRGDLDQQSA